MTVFEPSRPRRSLRDLLDEEEELRELLNLRRQRDPMNRLQAVRIPRKLVIAVKLTRLLCIVLLSAQPLLGFSLGGLGQVIAAIVSVLAVLLSFSDFVSETGGEEQ